MAKSTHSNQTVLGSDVVAGLRPLGLFFLLGLTACGEFTAQNRNTDGVQLFHQARYQDAVREFQEAAYADPAGANAYYNLAATYHRVGLTQRCTADLKQAENYYNYCLDRNSSHTECYRGLAVLLAQQGRKDEAFRLLEGWAQREPCAADPKIELARLNDEYGNRQVAKDQLLAVLEIQPDNPRALTALGKIREDAGEKAQALANYQRSLCIDNRQPQVAARVAAMQGNSTAVANTPIPPTIDLGTRVADRNRTPKQ
jgi:tetratricopeptide (TPR) repeat protein